MGLPYGTLVQRGSIAPIGNQFDQMAASVAPPRASTWVFGNARRTSSGNVIGTQSPLSMAKRKCGPPSLGKNGTKRCSAAECGIPDRDALRDDRVDERCAARACIPVLATTTVAPAPSAPNVSYTLRSKHGEVTNSSRLPGFTSKVRDTHSSVLITASCVSTTPLGLPVLPEV